MSLVAILTDSSCDISPENEKKYGIDILSFPILLDGQNYIERVSCSYEEFYQKMRDAVGVPTTAAVTQLQYMEQLEKYLNQGVTHVLIATINRTGSSAYNNCIMAVRMLREEHPEHTMKIRVVDSRTYSCAFGYYLCEAAARLRNGGELEYVAGILEQQMACADIVLSAYTLKQMKKSGRISAAAAFAGELLGLRPIISLTDGKTKVEAKVRGDDAVIPAMVKLVKSKMEDVENMEYQIGYTDDPERLKTLEKLCKKEFGHAPVNIFKLGCVVTANTGPDALAITFLGKNRGPREV